MYSELLKLFGFEPEEAERESPRIERAFKIWGITAEDVKRAEERIKRYLELGLTGMYKIRGIWLKEFVDMTLAKEEGKKVIYSSFPPIGEINGAIAIMSDDIYCCAPEPVLMTVLGQYFGKMGPLLEQAEKSWLPPGQAHCPYLQARMASILGGMVAAPDLLIAVGVTCDQAGKTDDLIQYLEGIPVVHIDSGPDEVGEYYPHPDPRRVRYLARELENIPKVFQQVIGLELTEAAMNRGKTEHGRFKEIFDKLQELRGKADPLPLSEKDWISVFDAMSSCAGRAIREGPDAAGILLKELQERVDRGEGVLEKGAPRVVNILAHSSDPAVTEVLERAGLASVVTGVAPSSLLFPSEYASVWEQIADRNLRHGTRCSSALMVRQCKEHCEEVNADGLVIAAVVKCRSQNIHPRKTKEVIEKELGIPVLAIELDSCDSREYTAEHFRTRVEPFAEMLKDRKKKALRD